MRQLGVRIGITLVVAIVATVGVLGTPAVARSRRHHRHHHHTGGGGGAPAPTPAPASSICTSSPNPALLNLSGNVVLSVSCHGLAPAEAVTVDSLLVRGNCGGVNLPLAVSADGNGSANFLLFGFGCLPGTYNVQMVGGITTTEFPVSFTF